MGYWDNQRPFSELVGLTLSSVVNVDNEEIHFQVVDGPKYVMYHEQDCCESVRVEEIIGDLADLVGSPITQADDVSSDDSPAPECADSYTWTFYRLATNKGHVVIRWLGESNGYYSEGVDFRIENA